jgi:hypothetical protein
MIRIEMPSVSIFRMHCLIVPNKHRWTLLAQAGRLGALPSRVLVVAHVRAQATCFCRLHLHNSPAAMVQAQDAVHCSIKARHSPITACASASATATEQVGR